jgi:SAM-dependent methyltransferase
MKNLHLRARFQRSFASRGFMGSLRHYTVRAWKILRPQRLTPHPFDVEHGVRTTAYIEGSQLAIGHAHDLYNTAYYGSAPSMVTAAIECWRQQLTSADPSIEEWTFIDIGAGLGRAVMIASLYPFQQGIGVEMNPDLVKQARDNLAIWKRTPRACSQIDVTAADATEFLWPRSPLVIYMFNPFEKPVMERLLLSLDNALNKGSGPIHILYMHPVESAVFDVHPSAQLLAATECYLTPEERVADLFTDKDATSSWAECRVYRIVGTP